MKLCALNSTMGIGRLGVLAVGLATGVAASGIGTPWEPGPGVAPATDGIALTAAGDFDISIWGIDLFHSGTTASAISTPGNMAFAFGDHSTAIAEGGFFNTALADGAGSSATAGSGVAADAGNSGDVATAFGAGSVAEAGMSGSYDSATAWGADSEAKAGFLGTMDSASAIGDHVQAGAGFGSGTDSADFDTANVWGSMFAPTTTLTYALAEGGDNNTAFVGDLFGTVGSSASALGNFDLAEALGDDLLALAVGNFIFHILPLF